MRQLNVQKALALELRMGEPIELPSKRAVNLARIFDELDLGVERIEAAIEEASPEAIARWPLDAESAGSEGGSRMVESARPPPPGAIMLSALNANRGMRRIACGLPLMPHRPRPNALRL